MRRATITALQLRNCGRNTFYWQGYIFTKIPCAKSCKSLNCMSGVSTKRKFIEVRCSWRPNVYTEICVTNVCDSGQGTLICAPCLWQWSLEHSYKCARCDKSHNVTQPAMLWWLATRYFWMQTTIMMHKDSTIWCPCKDGNLKIKYNNHHDHMMHRPVVLHLNQLRRGINVMFISERFCNPLLHFKMTKDDEMPKVEEMAAVTLTNILWETCTNILGLHWQIHHGSVWQPDQYDQVIKHGAGAEDISVCVCANPY